jgi:excisionase family DNA binding protein
MELTKQSYTTGDVAKLFGVASRTVTKWFDQGHLKGWRIPGSRDRRINRSEVIRFAKQHGMDIDQIKTRVVVATQDPDLIESLHDQVGGRDDWQYRIAPCETSAIYLCGRISPHCIAVDFSLGFDIAYGICASLQEAPETKGIKVLAILPTVDYWTGADQSVIDGRILRSDIGNEFATRVESFAN